MKKLPVVAIVGRPNVGKSSLFNRLVKRRLAIIDEQPGITRDRISSSLRWRKREFELVDTGGLDFSDNSSIIEKVRNQIFKAVEEADLLLFIVDIRAGLLPVDKEVADILRKSGKPVILVANKADHPRLFAQAGEFFALGLGEPLPVSVTQGINLGELLDKILKNLPPVTVSEVPSPIKIAVAGTPNTGKSTLVNKLLGEERVIVHEEPGTTRDTVEVTFQWRGKFFLLLDTAGLRRKSKVKEDIEWVSVKRAERSMEIADITFFLLDLSRPLFREDLRVGNMVKEKSKGAIVLLNKADLLKEEERERWIRLTKAQLHFLQPYPFIFTSGKTGENLDKVLEKAIEIVDKERKTIPPDTLKKFLKKILSHRPPRHDVSIYSLSQDKKDPSCFRIYTNNPKGIPSSYLKYIGNCLYKEFDWEGVTIRFKVLKK